MVLVVALVTLLVGSALAGGCDSSKYLPGHRSVPCIYVPSCDTSEGTTVSIALLSNGSEPFPADTTVTICHNSFGLRLAYVAENETLFKNTYQGCNSDMWNQVCCFSVAPPSMCFLPRIRACLAVCALQEVVEIFVTPVLEDNPLYHEIEVSVYNDLYVSLINNPYLNGTNMTHTMVPCQQSHIGSHVTIDRSAGSWFTTLQLPWTLINNVGASAEQSAVTDGPATKTWRFNVFRVRDRVSECALFDPLQQCSHSVVLFVQVPVGQTRAARS